jgi:mannose-6-phosphate isomerase-like protein (cupin superfamily)
MLSTLEAGRQTARRIYNPLQREAVTFLVTCDESGGERTYVEVELAPGGGNGLHVHTDFAEHFEVLEGELVVQVGSDEHVLGPGGTATAPPRTPHRFYSRSPQPTRFRVELRPGHRGFERALRMAFGMAADGLMTEKRMPRRLDHLALLVETSGTLPARFPAVLLPLFRLIARRARRRGVEAELLARYCPPFAPAEAETAAGW